MRRRLGEMKILKLKACNFSSLLSSRVFIVAECLPLLRCFTHISNLEVLLRFDTNDGLALNVHKYQSAPTNPAAADVEKCNLTIKTPLYWRGKYVSAALSRLQERKNSLYCPNNVLKKWANSELIFIDQQLKPLDELKRLVCSFNCNVVHTYKMLNGRFSRDAVTAAERNCKRRRNKKQRREPEH